MPVLVIIPPAPPTGETPTDCDSCGAGYGSGGWGAGPFGGGWGLGIDDTITETRQTALNAIDVSFCGLPLARNAGGATDALNPLNWALFLLEPFGAAVPLVQAVERISASVLRVLFDAPLATGARYTLVVSLGIEDVYGITIDPDCNEVEVEALLGAARVDPSIAAAGPDYETDLSNPFVPRDALRPQFPALGTLQVTDSGDYALEISQEAYLRKRILRRATTAVGGFVLAPEYGFAPGLKTRVTTSLLRRLQASALAQVRLEPDVLEASVAVTEDAPGLVSIRIRVVDRSGTEIVATVPVRFGT